MDFINYCAAKILFLLGKQYRGELIFKLNMQLKHEPEFL